MTPGSNPRPGSPAPRLPTTRGERLSLLGLALGLGGLLGMDLMQGFRVSKLSVPLVLVLWPAVLLLHHAGHVVAARMVGLRVSESVIGFGRELWRFRLGRARVVLHVLPIGGYVVAEPRTLRSPRLAHAWLHLGGPLASAMLLWGLSGTLGPLARAEPSVALVVLQSLAIAAGIALLVSLVPYSLRANPSAGLGVLSSLFGSLESLRQRALGPLLAEAERLLELELEPRARATLDAALEHYPGDPRLEGLIAVCEASAGRRAEAFARLEQAGPPERHAPPVRAALLRDAAWSVLTSGGSDEDLLADARRACRESLQLDPSVPLGHLLLGRVELSLGRAADAYEHLARAYANTQRLEEEAQCIAHLALACDELAERDASRRMAGYALRFRAALGAAALGPRLRERTLRALARQPDPDRD